MASSDRPSEVCRRVIYHGRVQGVGFRYTVNQLAQHRPVCGFVKNRPDGTVELVVQSSAQNFEDFHQAIRSVFDGFITSAEVEEISPPRSFSRFEIQRF